MAKELIPNPDAGTEEDVAVKVIKADYENALRVALDALSRAQSSLESAKQEIEKAADGQRSSGEYMLPGADTLQRAVAAAARFRALWAVLQEIDQAA